MEKTEPSTRPAGPYRAVFFDIGGVVVGSPFEGIAEFEKDHHLPSNYLNVAIIRAGKNGAFQKLERGEIDLWSFYDAFSEQLSDPRNKDAYAQYATLRGKEFNEAAFQTPKVDGRELFHRMMTKATVVNPCMVEAIGALRKAGYIVAALTNNFDYPSDEKGQQEQELILQIHTNSSSGSAQSSNYPSSSGADSGVLIMGQERLKTLFNHYIESTVLGLRKPDPAIYHKACEIAGVQPSEVVFLDDIGANLKSAQKVGLKTVRVELGKPEKAIQELEKVLGNGIKLFASSASKL
ncbi:hypothetical protein BGW38_008800 [Lunasporangiospora selenospora]|uniref:Hydrolase of the HAD superfamily n=1 Tax=Lunasporangiospora selenospora TaxID=979761 RepID=A0A9P6KG57_9FUNG|nr:hypothetical protein BGW38_008800 [Lunasporangiospora selenospora]